MFTQAETGIKVLGVRILLGSFQTVYTRLVYDISVSSSPVRHCASERLFTQDREIYAELALRDINYENKTRIVLQNLIEQDTALTLMFHTY